LIAQLVEDKAMPDIPISIAWARPIVQGKHCLSIEQLERAFGPDYDLVQFETEQITARFFLNYEIDGVFMFEATAVEIPKRQLIFCKRRRGFVGVTWQRSILLVRQEQVDDLPMEGFILQPQLHTRIFLCQ
jgi:hypothetical protein